ncbi:MAG: hypothetical protein KDA60_04475 [Planctomycetales bacterium]|nr:hypothetical protein [Planctomycetales bacterium]
MRNTPENRQVFCIAALVCALTGVSPLAADEGYPILLRNDEVVVGRLERLPGSYRIRFANRGFAIVDRNQVLFAGPDLTAVYEFKKENFDSQDAHQQLKMAEWCLAQNLFDEAEDHIGQGRQLGQPHEAERLAERLHVLKHAGRDITDGEPNESPSSSELPVASKLVDAERMGESNMSREEILESFNRQVQPVLLRSCGSAHCHGYASESNFRIRRPPRSVRPNRSITMHNLAQAKLQLGQFDTADESIDSDEDDELPLVHWAVTAHGGVSSSPVAAKSRQHELLESWALAAAGRTIRTPSPAPMVRLEEPSVLVNGDGDSFDLRDGKVVRISHTEPEAARETLIREESTRAGDVTTTASQSSVQPVSEDPFDPAPYNDPASYKASRR